MKSLKTRLVAVVTMFSVLMCGNVNADNVDLQTAKQIGAYYYNVATGTKAPVILTSRSDNCETKVNSIALAAVVAESMK